ncbi:MAG: response regulator [Myxococcales bacterium]|nr:response regulator [Myxococcales bacterium]
MGSEYDIVASRDRLVKIGMGAVFIACVVFAVLRLGVSLATGKATPWWGNAAGAVVVLLLHLWYRVDPERRSGLAVHGTALAATIALLVPSFYSMPSSKWWLSLVGFAVVLMGRTREAVIWGVATGLLIPVVAAVEPHVVIPNAIGEPLPERVAAGALYVLILLGITLAYRRAARQRAVELKQTAESLERSSRVRNRFLAHMSHEIRTPLHGVIAMTDLALAEELPASAKKNVEGAAESASVLLTLLNNLLDVTRMEADAVELVEAPFDLHATLGDALRPLAARAESAGLGFSARAEPGVIAQRRGDRVRLTQIVLNLVGNALKFTDRGEIAVSLGGDERRVTLSVRDTGRGIAPADHEAVFRPFVQVSSGDVQFENGAGVGLAIAGALAKLMDGGIRLMSEVGRGAEFIVDVALPVVEGSDVVGPVDLLEPVALPTSLRASPARHLRVLVCEDELMNRRAVQRMLRLLGHECELAEDGECAWDVIQREEDAFDVLLTDLEMPRLDGLELIRRIRAREREDGSGHLPIVATTAHVGEDEQHRLLEAGADAHLGKPFTASGLEQVVLRVARQSVETRERGSTAPPPPG